MRFLFVASLLFSGSIGFFELASGNSILQTAWQHYNAHKDEVLQHGQKQVRQLLSRAAQAHSAGTNRDLQFTLAPTSAPLCNADGSVNYDSEEFTQPEVYGPEVNTMCTCMQQNNAKEIEEGPDPAPFFKNYSYAYTDCFTYTSGTSLNGKICFGLDFDEPTDYLALEIPCTIEYDGVPCSSCFSRFVAFDNFLFADCTNIDSSAMINGFNGTGFVGPFVYLDALKGGSSVTQYTIGSCDLSSPTAPVPDAPVAAPVALSPAPVTDIPVSAPVALSPAPVTNTPVTSVIDTPVATPVAVPPAPVAVPTAPVVAPVRAPVAAVTTPTAPVSGSFTIGVALNVLVLVATVAYLA